MDDKTRYEMIEKGRKAQIVKDLPEFTYVLEEIKKDLFNRFTSLDLGNDDEVANIHATTKAINRIVLQIDNYISLGKQANDIQT
ncbi:hypothetical protein G6M86_20995 [Agrobacterium tumefaciens]|uniref:Uncharacterized protein n=1 Tax=Agrobacterium tumefaciens TaxID=358 RepID=A0AAJ4N6G8_AGRTU|nr:hypothetical protein G6M86_20995 [Agrobacterium tumefaciens]